MEGLPIDFDKKMHYGQCVWNELCTINVQKLLEPYSTSIFLTKQKLIFLTEFCKPKFLVGFSSDFDQKNFDEKKNKDFLKFVVKKKTKILHFDFFLYVLFLHINSQEMNF